MTHVNYMTHRIAIGNLSAGPVLSGALRGQELLVKLLPKVGAEPSEPKPVFLDFSGIDAATASFLRESVLALRDFFRGRRSNIFPVIANANSAVCEDLGELVKSRGGVLVVCDLAADGEVTSPRILGSLDPKQQLTFDLVRQYGETDAAELMRTQISESVGATAWNNRLSSLVNLGVIVEGGAGRTKRYRPLLQGV